MKPQNAKTVTLILTQDCNLNCIYCYEHNKSKKSMSFDTAKKILDYHLKAVDNYDYIYINLFGGEPFLKFDLIKQIYEYSKKINNQKKILFVTTTNGTLVHGDIQKWLYSHKNDFHCGLSADGTENMHNYNRCNSYSKIDFDFFKNTWPNNPVKITVSPYSLNTLADGIIHLHKLGFDVCGSIAYGIDWNKDGLIEILDRELIKLIEYYTNNPNINLCGMLDFPIELITGEVPKKIKKWCGSGVEMYTYDIDGKCYPCQFFTPTTIGEERSKEFIDKKFNRYVDKEELNNMCKICPLIPSCPTCNGANFQENGRLYYKTEKYCKIMKRLLLATSKIKWIRFNQGLYTDLSDVEKYQLLTGINAVQKTIGKTNC